MPPPPTTWDKPWTFAQFLDTANALTQRDGSGRATQWGFVNTWWSYYAAGLFAMNNGVPWSTPLKDPTQMNFGDPAFIEAVQFYADLANKHKAAPNASETQSMSTPDLFAAGKAAMALGGHWRYQTFIEAEGLDFDVTSLPIGPSLPAGRAAVSNIGATGLAISASSQRKEQAWEFVKFAAGPVGQKIIGESCLFAPALRSALNSDGFAKAHHRVRNLAVLTTGPDHSDALPVTPAWEKVVALMDREFGPVLRGSRPATSLDGFSARRRRGAALLHDVARHFPPRKWPPPMRAPTRLGRSPVLAPNLARGLGVPAVSPRVFAVHELSAVGRVQSAEVRRA